MPFRSEIISACSEVANLERVLFHNLAEIAKLRQRNVIFYASAFLERPGSTQTSIEPKDMDGLMDSIHGLDCQKGLSLILHTPGGSINAADSIVDYLHKKFDTIEVIVPRMAMSAGSMISLTADLIIMGQQSQLGPIDPLIFSGGEYHSARAIKEAFAQAKKDFERNANYVHLWAPILQTMAPALLLEAISALKYSESLVKKWMKQKMLKGKEEKEIDKVAAYFNARRKNSTGDKIHDHGQRIAIDELTTLGLNTKALEDDQDLHQYVMTAYYAVTILFERTITHKMIANQDQRKWIV